MCLEKFSQEDEQENFTQDEKSQFLTTETKNVS